MINPPCAFFVFFLKQDKISTKEMSNINTRKIQFNVGLSKCDVIVMRK